MGTNGSRNAGLGTRTPCPTNLSSWTSLSGHALNDMLTISRPSAMLKAESEVLGRKPVVLNNRALCRRLGSNQDREIFAMRALKLVNAKSIFERKCDLETCNVANFDLKVPGVIPP